MFIIGMILDIELLSEKRADDYLIGSRLLRLVREFGFDEIKNHIRANQ